MTTSEPFIVLGFHAGDLPAEDQRPFSIAGLIAIWRPVDDMDFFPQEASSDPEAQME
ncbi:hypothetical protein QBC46DRAFT_343822 [Diplogelasinospora grovesii]|uniref:Uncharacterized protein n=1 Tax=Diplogelasinospora grovesii TaxID=303347 RepID=A0AAN6N399_9PEZI|nr:hypothetical protein QBC46DRAFT_343822 [Diplogelasinospora grovesii]